MLSETNFVLNLLTIPSGDGPWRTTQAAHGTPASETKAHCAPSCQKKKMPPPEPEMMGAGCAADVLGVAAGLRPLTRAAASCTTSSGVSCAGGSRGRSASDAAPESGPERAGCCCRCHGRKLLTVCGPRPRLGCGRCGA